jgi:hypothetical protein
MVTPPQCVVLPLQGKATNMPGGQQRVCIETLTLKETANAKVHLLPAEGMIANRPVVPSSKPVDWF